MTKVTNKFDGTLMIADVLARPGATVEVDDTAFRDWANGDTAKQWLKAGVIESDSKSVNTAGSVEAQTDAQRTANATAPDREALLQRARDLGLNPNANTGVQKLTEMIATAEADAARTERTTETGGEAPQGPTSGTNP